MGRPLGRVGKSALAPHICAHDAHSPGALPFLWANLGDERHFQPKMILVLCLDRLRIDVNRAHVIIKVDLRSPQQLAKRITERVLPREQIDVFCCPRANRPREHAPPALKNEAPVTVLKDPAGEPVEVKTGNRLARDHRRRLRRLLHRHLKRPRGPVLVAHFVTPPSTLGGEPGGTRELPDSRELVRGQACRRGKPVGTVRDTFRPPPRTPHGRASCAGFRTSRPVRQ